MVPGQLLTPHLCYRKGKVQLSLRPGDGAAFRTWKEGVVQLGMQGGVPGREQQGEGWGEGRVSSG